MPIPISRKAKECFGENTTPSFEFLSNGLPPGLEGCFSIQHGEECVGLYRNGTDLKEAILATTLGIHTSSQQGSSNFIPYTEIENITWKTTDRSSLAQPENRELLLALRNGNCQRLPVKGDWYSQDLKCGGLDLGNFHQFLQSAMVVAKIPERNI